MSTSAWTQLLLGAVEGLGLAILYVRHQRMVRGTADEYEYNGLPVDLCPWTGTGLTLHVDEEAT
jgi:hypothetical protein